MSIVYDSNKQTFSLHTENSTYQMQVDRLGYLLHLYYGRRTPGCMDYLLTYTDRGFSGNPYDAGMDRTYSMDVLPQEFPTQGIGDYRNVALSVRHSGNYSCCDLRYVSHRIYDGKYALKGLPAVYGSREDSQSLEILLRDKVSGVEVTLLYGVIEDLDIITRSLIITNTGNERVFLDSVMSCCVDFITGSYDLLFFHGRHCMERQLQRTPVHHGTIAFGSKRGTSSHQYNPSMILAERGTGEMHGGCLGVSFVYSGGFQASVEHDQYHQTRVMMGLQEESLLYPLDKGDSFTAPETILSWSNKGFNQLSYNMHRCIRNHVCRGRFKSEARPVLVNSWEGAYFDFTGETIYKLAEAAKNLGIDMVVMDDGWFGNRNDDSRALGDWIVNEDKLGESLGSLSERIHGLGMKFGIWVEPEGINEDSDLYRAHPDWALSIPGRNPVRARNQLVLDFSRQEVVNHVYDMVCDVLDQARVDYLKWDMNRSLDCLFSYERSEQGTVAYDYVLGLYDFLERLNQRYPDMLIEGCSGGGGRFDVGMLYYTPQIWCSDNTDAIDRIRIQYGTSFFYPVCTMGSHASAVPNHQNGRITSLDTRGTVAMAGTFGYELDLVKLTEEEKAIVRRQTADYKRFASLIFSGRYYRLTTPFSAPTAAWEFVSEDGSQVLFNAVRLELHSNSPTRYVALKGLIPGRFYRDEATGRIYPSDALMQSGLPMSMEIGEYISQQIYLKLVG